MARNIIYIQVLRCAQVVPENHSLDTTSNWYTRWQGCCLDVRGVSPSREQQAEVYFGWSNLYRHQRACRWGAVPLLLGVQWRTKKVWWQATCWGQCLMFPLTLLVG